MKSKQELLGALREGLETGVISESEVRALLHQPVVADELASATTPERNASLEKSEKHEKLSAVDIMFYIAGLVLFSAIISMIVQTWSDGSMFVHILLSSGLGALFWAIAYYLLKSKYQSDIRKGFVNSLLLTGSLSMIAGGYIVTYDVIKDFSDPNSGFLPMAIALAALSALHLAYNRLVKRDMILLLGVLLGVASFPTLLFGFLQAGEAAMDMYSLVVIGAAGLLLYATRVAAKANPDQPKVRTSFDGFAVFVALMAMYVSGYGDYGVVWTVALLAAVFGLFYLSIVTQRKLLLGNASVFLVLSVVTISFKYFSGFGITTSLIVATFGLLGTAAIAATINRKYFKSADLATDSPVSSAVEVVPFPATVPSESTDKLQGQVAEKTLTPAQKTEDHTATALEEAALKPGSDDTSRPTEKADSSRNAAEPSSKASDNKV